MRNDSTRYLFYPSGRSGNFGKQIAKIRYGINEQISRNYYELGNNARLRRGRYQFYGIFFALSAY